MFSVVVFGVIGESVKTRHLALFGGLVFTLSMIPMILSTGQTYTIFVHNMIWATGGGAYITANNLIWPNYFGRRFLGTIRGIVFPVQVAATGLGPPVYGFLLDAGVAHTTLWMVSGELLRHVGHSAVHGEAPQRKAEAKEEPATLP